MRTWMCRARTRARERRGGCKSEKEGYGNTNYTTNVLYEIHRGSSSRHQLFRYTSLQNDHTILESTAHANSDNQQISYHLSFWDINPKFVR